MKNKRNFCFAIVSIAFLCLISDGTAIAHCPSNSIAAVTSEHLTTLSSTEANLFANDIGWKYKLVNGVIYKRKYDFTLNRWIGDWIKA